MMRHRDRADLQGKAKSKGMGREIQKTSAVRGCEFINGAGRFLPARLSWISSPLLPKVRKNPPPLAFALIPGVFVKVRKTLPPNFAHLESAGGDIGLRPQLRKTPPPSFAHLIQH